VTAVWTIQTDDLSGGAIRALLEQHFAGMLANSPKDSCHFLDFEGLQADGVTFWSIWDGDSLAGCGALKRLDAGHGEIKSMRVADAYRGRGAGHAMLMHIIAMDGSVSKPGRVPLLAMRSGSMNALALRNVRPLPTIGLTRSANS
jgi:putative acetyltransferase